MRSSHKTFATFLVFYTCFVVSCEEEATKATAEEEVDPCASEEQFSTIQALIDAASSGDTILVDPGTYEGSINFQGKDVVVGSLFLTTGDSSYISQTILDGKQKGSVVRFENNETNGSSLVGVTVTGGNAVEGGGIYIKGASPTLSHLLITGNKAYTCEVGDYVKEATGAGIYVEGGNPSISKVRISENSSEAEGGGIYMNSSDLSMDLVKVRSNTASTFGGGIYFGNSGPTLSRVVVEYNEAVDGGGLYLSAFSSPSLVNTVVGNNIASNEGGGIYLNNAQTDLVNVTVVDDSAFTYGGSMFMKGGTVKTRNTIITGGGPDAIWFSKSGVSSSMTVHYSSVQGGLEGIEDNSNGTIDWGEGNLTGGGGVNADETSEILGGGNYCHNCPRWYLVFQPDAFSFGAEGNDKGDPSSQYNDEENLWCHYVWATEAVSIWNNGNPGYQQIAVPDTLTERNDMGAFGGPNGSWGIIHATPGSDWE